MLAKRLKSIFAAIYMAQGPASLLTTIIVYILMKLLCAFRLVSDYVAFPIMTSIKSGQFKPLPTVKDKILLMSAVDLGDKIRSGELSSQIVVKAFINRLREINPIVNAVTDERYKAALEEAKAADLELEQTRSNKSALDELKSLKPFLGVPITTKNALAVRGLGNEAGLYLKKGMKASSDSFPVLAMKKSGAIFIAVTNTPEMCLWLESDNALFGKTGNAYNTFRTSGGSSGGEGVILSACGSPFGIGTDIAGSTRIPAFYNGIFGLKPTKGTVDISGHFPMPKHLLHPLLIAGPMCKYSKDLRPVLRALVPTEIAQKMKLDAAAPDLSKLKVYYVEDFGSSIITPVIDEIRECTKTAALHLASLGKYDAKPTTELDLSSATEIFLAYLLLAECPSLAEELALSKGRISVRRELFKLLLGRSKHTLPALTVCLLEEIFKNDKSTPVTNALFDLSIRLKNDVEKLLGENGVLVCPTLPDYAPHHGLSLLRPWNVGYTAIWNVLGFPAVAIPMGLSDNGMPIGVTVVAGNYKDNTCCQIAVELEKAFGGWVPPFKVSQ